MFHIIMGLICFNVMKAIQIVRSLFSEVSVFITMFTHAGLTPDTERKTCNKAFVLSRSYDIKLMKRIESLLKIAGMKI